MVRINLFVDMNFSPVLISSISEVVDASEIRASVESRPRMSPMNSAAARKVRLSIRMAPDMPMNEIIPPAMARPASSAIRHTELLTELALRSCSFGKRDGTSAISAGLAKHSSVEFRRVRTYKCQGLRAPIQNNQAVINTSMPRPR
ncbi:hypothetical protein D3C78_1049020 [compost metagenome]